MAYETDADEGSKQSQEAANYRRGSPVKCCGNCTNFQGGDSCAVVESPVSPYGVSDSFAMAKNPFGSTLGPKEIAVINRMMESPQDESYVAQAVRTAPVSAARPAPGLRIGSKTYG
jgi:recombinational DNA repair protein RecR